VWVLLLTCVAVALVIVQQGTTVDRQRELIRVLDQDSRQLFSSRMHDLANRRLAPKANKPKPDQRPATPPAERKPIATGARLVRST
jgi:hypothetical protein